MPAEFRGWSEAALDFYAELEVENSKSFWDSHKTTYEAEVRAPFEALSVLVADEFAPLKLSRPYRDLRFSRDKTPYKTRGYALGYGRHGETFYVEISATGLRVATGYWMMGDDQVARYREAVDDEKRGQALERAVAAVRAAALEVIGQELKTAPRGYPRDHPRVALLRHKSMAAMQWFAPAGWLGTRAAADRITDVWRAAGPLNEWLAGHVGPSIEPPMQGGGRAGD